MPTYSPFGRNGIALGQVVLCDHVAVAYDTSRLAELGAERTELTEKLAANRPEWLAEILAASKAGVGTVEIARLAGVTRDAVRQLLNNAKAGK